MDIGLLWYDSGASDLSRKLAQAAARYKARFGESPNVCYVNPAQLPEGERQVDGIRVRTSQRILRHHFWLGQEVKTV
ncbi:MAG: hypothetical protein JXA33_27245 [Anaerolineae bacterium]|nr:hypothetical protein [Anaerolineae bacterium]